MVYVFAFCFYVGVVFGMFFFCYCFVFVCFNYVPCNSRSYVGRLSPCSSPETPLAGCYPTHPQVPISRLSSAEASRVTRVGLRVLVWWTTGARPGSGRHRCFRYLGCDTGLLQLMCSSAPEVLSLLRRSVSFRIIRGLRGSTQKSCWHLEILPQAWTCSTRRQTKKDTKHYSDAVVCHGHCKQDSCKTQDMRQGKCAAWCAASSTPRCYGLGLQQQKRVLFQKRHGHQKLRPVSSLEGFAPPSCCWKWRANTAASNLSMEPPTQKQAWAGKVCQAHAAHVTMQVRGTHKQQISAKHTTCPEPPPACIHMHPSTSCFLSHGGNVEEPPLLKNAKRQRKGHWGFSSHVHNLLQGRLRQCFVKRRQSAMRPEVVWSKRHVHVTSEDRKQGARDIFLQSPPSLFSQHWFLREQAAGLEQQQEKSSRLPPWPLSWCSHLSGVEQWQFPTFVQYVRTQCPVCKVHHLLAQYVQAPPISLGASRPEGDMVRSFPLARRHRDWAPCKVRAAASTARNSDAQQRTCHEVGGLSFCAHVAEAWQAIVLMLVIMWLRLASPLSFFQVAQRL